MRLRLLLFVIVAALAAVGSASAHTSKSEQQLRKATTVVSWYEGKGAWTLRPRYRYCVQLVSKEAERRCARHRRTYAAHRALVKRLSVPAIPERWLRIADCETGGDEYGRPPYRAVWDYNGSSGFDGGVQFSPGTWNMAKVKPEVARIAAGYAYAYQAPPAVQVAVAENWLGYTSWLQWPSCSRSVGLR